MDHVFSDPDSVYNKFDDAAAFHQKRSKLKLMTLLVHNLRENMIEDKVEDMIHRREEKLLVGMF
jgi:hypothetical protein